MRRILSVIVFLSLALLLKAQDATVNKDITTVVCNSLQKMTVTHHREITINNKQADELACFDISIERKSMNLSSFSGQIADANGKVLKKIKKGDLQASEYSTEFKTNAYSLIYDYTPASFPLHVTYDVTLEYSNLVVGFNGIDPYPGYNVNVEEASYTLTVPSDMNVRYFAQNTTAKVEKTTKTDGGKTLTVYSVTMNNLPALKEEPCSPSFSSIEPSIEFVPETFNCYGSQGSFDSWEALGKWHWALVDGRQAIPETIAAQVDQAVAGKDNKVEQCCALMRKLTRYISIQLGIGGWQPETAETTARTGLGDCKALTCLLMGMLEHVGVKSYPVIVNFHKKHLPRDFASLGQTNHMFLCVPQEKDTLWVECTNFEIPAVYRHDGLAGHDAVILTPEGGKFVTIPDYAPTDNKWTSVIDIKPQAGGKTSLDIHLVATNAQYEDLYPLTHATDKEQKTALTSRFNLGRVEEYKTFQILTTDNLPLLMTNIETESTGYATISGSRMIIPVNPMHPHHSLLPTVKDRTQRVVRNAGYEDQETIHIAILEGYAIEAMPKPVDVETPFGHLTLKAEVKDNVIDINYDVVRNTFEGGPETYQPLCDFVKQIHSAYGQKIILKKQ